MDQNVINIKNPKLKKGDAKHKKSQDQATPVYRIQRFFDVVISSILLVLLSPLMLAIATLVKLTSKGPAIYSQVRVGINRRKSYRGHLENRLSQLPSSALRVRQENQFGRPFHVYKFRSMVMGAEANGKAVWAKANDPRVTFIGNILRKTHLDELPQLFNILKGDMSLVGPRPERPHIIEDLRRTISNYELRLKVRPGVTGLAQIRHRADVVLDDVRKKIRYDSLYIRRRSLLIDVKIILNTLPLSIGFCADRWREIRRSNTLIRAYRNMRRSQRKGKKSVQIDLGPVSPSKN